MDIHSAVNAELYTQVIIALSLVGRQPAAFACPLAWVLTPEYMKRASRSQRVFRCCYPSGYLPEDINLTLRHMSATGP